MKSPPPRVSSNPLTETTLGTTASPSNVYYYSSSSAAAAAATAPIVGDVIDSERSSSVATSVSLNNNNSNCGTEAASIHQERNPVTTPRQKRRKESKKTQHIQIVEGAKAISEEEMESILIIQRQQQQNDHLIPSSAINNDDDDEDLLLLTPNRNTSGSSGQNNNNNNSNDVSCHRSALELQLGLMRCGNGDAHHHFKAFRKYFMVGVENPFRCSLCMSRIEEHQEEAVQNSANDEIVHDLVSDQDRQNIESERRRQQERIIRKLSASEEEDAEELLLEVPEVSSSNVTTSPSQKKNQEKNPMENELKMTLGETVDVFQNDRLLPLAHGSVFLFVVGVILLAVYFVLGDLPDSKPVLFVPPCLVWLAALVCSIIPKRRRLEFDLVNRTVRVDLRPSVWYWIFGTSSSSSSSTRRNNNENSHNHSDHVGASFLTSDVHHQRKEKDDEKQSSSFLAANTDIFFNIDFDSVVTVIAVPVKNNTEQPEQSFWSVVLVYFDTRVKKINIGTTTNSSSNNNVVGVGSTSLLVKKIATIPLENVRELEKEEVVEKWKEYLIGRLKMNVRDR